MDSMLDLEQLRMSVSECDIPSAISQVHHWIDTHGLALLRANQRLPFDYAEAEEIRKQHEKVELKCMTFLAFYAKINLKNIPEEYEEMREDMDITIHKFSEHIKARRHLVVSSFTLFRHLQELQDKLIDFQNVDLSDLPDSIEDINILIGKFHKNTNHCLKRLSHLKDEADRVKSSMDTIVTLSNTPGFDYIDIDILNESKVHIDRLLKDMEVEVTRIFESQRLLELELKIEAKMMVIEDDINRCCGWLQRMEQKLVDRYNDKVVGMATVENDVLCQETQELADKMRLTKEYGAKLIEMHDKLCDQFRRDKSRGQSGGDKLNELWALADLLSTESLGRLNTTGKLFHGLDSTLDKVEDMLLSINKDKDNGLPSDDIIDKYSRLRAEVYSEFHELKQLANELFRKLQCNLFNERLQAANNGYLEAEQTEDMVKMKIFTIAVKLKELDRCIFNDNIPEIVGQKVSKTFVEPSFSEPPDDDLHGNIDKFLKFLKTTQLNWESKPLPVSLDQSVKALKEHQDASNHSEQYWKDIQNALGSMSFQSKNAKDDYQQLLSNATREKRNWDGQWRKHLDEELNPRHGFLKKLHDYNSGLGENLNTLDELLTRPNHNLALVQEVNGDLEKMRHLIPRKEETLEDLHTEANSIHRTDFKNQLTIVDENLQCYRDRLSTFKELETMIEEILQFLPHLSKFKNDWPQRVSSSANSPVEINNLKNEADRMKANISKFDRGRLRKLATKSYGNGKKVEWIIEELKAEFPMPEEEFIKPKVRGRQEMASPEVTNSPAKKPLTNVAVSARLHSPTELNFRMETLPRVDKDQYNLQWYRNNVRIDPDKDPRIVASCEPRRGRANIRIENCEYSDAGQYWLEVHDEFPEVLTTNPVTLTVTPQKSASAPSVDPTFGERVFAGRNDPLSLELKLDGFRFAPESELTQNSKPIHVNQRDCPWIRVSSNTAIEFSNPAITDFDRGLYEVLLNDKVVAKTQLIVGDAPRFMRHQHHEKVKLGDTVAICIPTVDIANKADQKAQWKKGDGLVSPDGGKYRIGVNEGGDPYMEIAHVQAGDAGVYTCEVSNVYGKTSAKVVLEIVDKGPQEVQNKRNAPTFVQSLKKEVTTRGDEPVLLKCKVVGNPLPIVKWTKDGKEVAVSDFVKTKNMGDVHELSILNPRAADSGTYEIVASNSQGFERSKCVLKVATPHNIPVSEITVPKFVVSNERTPDDLSDVEQTPQRTQLIFSNTVVRSPPQFVTTFTDEVVHEGDDVVLKCCLIGQPEPVIWWSYNTHLLKNPRFEMDRQLDEYRLHMRNVKEEDSGRYSMTAENSSGLATCSALVIVDKKLGQGRSLDRSQYKTNSRPMNSINHPEPFQCHTTLSNSLNASLPDESRIMQVSPRGWEEPQRPKSSPNSPHVTSRPIEVDSEPIDNVDFSKSKTRTVKTYHYSGPSGIDLPGIGFIPKIKVSPSPSPVPSPSPAQSSSSSDDHIGRAVFVPGVKKPPPPIAPKPVSHNYRFSVVESSECDYPL